MKYYYVPLKVGNQKVSKYLFLNHFKQYIIIILNIVLENGTRFDILLYNTKTL